MKHIIALITLAATSVLGQVTVNIQCTLSEERVWALTQDWQDWVQAGMQTNGVSTNTLAKLPWFQQNATNDIIKAADRSLERRKQQFESVIRERWKSLTPAQITNMINALPPQ